MREQIAPSVSTSALDRDWWRGAVIYQIYPRSFLDTSGDGVGDLLGIAQKMDYVAELGVDAIWISPFYPSPMKDFGYDVSDYLSVDPMFGSLFDFDQIVTEAHSRGLKVMIDLVLSHTSAQHPWFQQSRSSRDNEKSNWYVWADAKADGTPPSNWLSIFGGSAWSWDAGRCQYYLHNFLAAQPDLNFHCAAVQDELLAISRFWLERGVDGFRLDTINFFVHDVELRDNPPLPKHERNDSIAPTVNPYNHQNHLYDKNRPENLTFLKRFRAVMEEFPATASLGEVGDAQYGLEIVSDYTSGSDKVHMCYAFDFLASTPPAAGAIGRILTKFQQSAPDGWACWAFSNHDVMRHASRWPVDEGGQDKYLSLLAGLLLSLRGSVCLYQGEELGLTEADVPFEAIRDPYGKEFWPDYKGRDGCRTPMVWRADEQNAGFSTNEPWLPIPAEHRRYAVDMQDSRVGSTLNQYRNFLKFRRQHRALIKGDLVVMEETEPVLAFTRHYNNETIYCAFNLTSEERFLTAPDELGEPLEGHGYSGQRRESVIEIPPYDAFFARIE